MKITSRLLGVATAAALCITPVAQAHAQAVESANYVAARIDGKTEVEKAIGRCVATIAIGALLGAAVADSRRRGEGAMLGAAAGGVVCAIMMSVASKKDKEYVRALQLQVLNSGQPVSQDWQTTDNKAASATVSASDVVQVSAPKTEEVLNCRRVNTELRVDGQNSSSSDVVCLKGDSWLTLDKLKPYGVRAQDVSI